ncbi:MAG TPA: hypothetical protein VJN62_03905 [Gemmatimonadales bacterium]|nr:hypothetical protein [Gemmatimonadales bacterium]
MKGRHLLLLATMLACNEAITPPTFDIDGRWAYNVVDAGSVMQVTQQDGAITGEGTRFRNAFGTDSFQVQGTYTPPLVILQFVYTGSQACSYIATLQDPGVTMVGTMTCGGKPPASINFSR